MSHYQKHAESHLVERLKAQIAKLEAELNKRAKQIGVACVKHDLISSLACGACHKEALEQIAKLEAENAELTRERNDYWALELVKASNQCAQLREQIAKLEAENKTLREIYELVVSIPNMSNEQLEQLKANCLAAMQLSPGDTAEGE